MRKEIPLEERLARGFAQAQKERLHGVTALIDRKKRNNRQRRSHERKQEWLTRQKLGFTEEGYQRWLDRQHLSTY